MRGSCLCCRRLRAVLVLGATLWVVACGGGRENVPGPDAGVTRQFDEYPASLSIEGAAIVESGAVARLQARADNNEYRGPAYLTTSAAQTLSVRSSPEGLGTPASVLLGVDRDDRNFLTADLDVTAPVVTAPTRFSVSIENPRAGAQRELTVVPAGAFYIRRLLLSRPIVEAGQALTIEIELSQPAPTATEVQLSATLPSRFELPTTVTVPANVRSATVTVLAQEAPGQDYVTISATLDGLAQQASLWVRSGQAFVLKIELDRHYLASSPGVSYHYAIPVQLSKPAGPDPLTITLTSNNTFAPMPASILASPGVERVMVPFEIAPFMGLSAVRITASGGGTTRIGDALLGRDEGTPVIESLTLHRLRASATAGIFSESGPCFDSNNRSHGIRIYGRANVTLDRAAPAGGFRVNLFARSSVLLLRQEFSIPAGAMSLGFDFEVPTGTAGDKLRFVKVIARSVDTLQERSDTLLVGEGGGSALAELTSGDGSLGEATNFIPYFDWDPQPVAGGVLRGRVTLGEVEANGNFVEAHTHGSDDVPVYLTLTESDAPYVPIRVPTATVTIPALLGYADFSLPLPAGAARQLVLRADAYSPDRTGIASTPCNLSYSRPVDVSAGGTLSFAEMVPRQVFGGQGGSVTVALSVPAPAGGAIVELAANAPPSYITMPEQIVVPAGAMTASVPFATNPVPGFVTVDVLARYGNSTSARVEVMPEPAPLGVRFVPPSLAYGSAASLRIDLPARYPVPLVAALSADIDSATLLSLPSTVVIPTRQLSVTVPVPVLLRNAGGQTPVTVRATVRQASADAQGEIASIYNWSDIGAPISVAGVAQAPSMGGYFARESETSPLMFASVDTDPGAQGRLFVRRFSTLTGAWTVVGPGALNPTSLTSASQPSLLNDGFGLSGSRPILAFTQGNGVQQNVFVVRFDPVVEEWVDLSASQTRLNAKPNASRAVQPVLETLSTGSRVAIGLAFIEDGAVQFAWFDGIVWRYASPPSSMAGNARDVRFLRGPNGIYHPGGVARLVWVDDGDANVPIKAAELDLAGGPWTALPAPPVPPAAPGTQRLEFFSATNDNSIVWSQSTLPAQVMRARYDENANVWTTTPADAPADPADRITALALDRRGYASDVMYATDSGPGRRRVWLRRFDGATWVNRAPADVVAERVVDLSFASNGNDEVKAASVRRSDDGTQYTLQVRGIYAP